MVVCIKLVVVKINSSISDLSSCKITIGCFLSVLSFWFVKVSSDPRVECLWVSKLLFFDLLEQLSSCDLSLNIFIDYNLDVFLLILLKMTNNPAPPSFEIPELLLNLL